jgi:hypothetical protein
MLTMSLSTAASLLGPLNIKGNQRTEYAAITVNFGFNAGVTVATSAEQTVVRQRTTYDGPMIFS